MSYISDYEVNGGIQPVINYSKMELKEVIYGPTSIGYEPWIFKEENEGSEIKSLFQELKKTASVKRMKLPWKSFEIHVESYTNYDSEDSSLRMYLYGVRDETDKEYKKRTKLEEGKLLKWRQLYPLWLAQKERDKKREEDFERKQYLKLKKKFEGT